MGRIARIASHASVAVSLAALGGCGLPPVVVIASYAADTLSYATTGKSTTDHVISAAADRDCALLRMAHDEAVCRKSERNLREENEQRTAALTAAAAASPEVPAGMIVIDGAALEEAAREEIGWTPPDEPAPIVVALAIATATDPAERDLSAIAPSVAAATPRPAGETVLPEPAAPDGWMLVLGSYPDAVSATGAVRRFLSFRPEVVTATVSGRRYHRVVAGPYDAITLASVRVRAREAGANDAWGAPLCPEAVTGPRCIAREK